MQLNFFGNQCLQPESIFSFLIKFMLAHNHAFHIACNLCPFGYCYKYFIGTYAAFQIVYSSKELLELFKEETGEREELMFTIKYLDIPITNHNLNIILNTHCLSRNFDLLVLIITSETAEELVGFSFVSLISIIYSCVMYGINFHKLTKERKIVQFMLSLASILNLSFMLCYIFENYKNCGNL